MVYSFGFLIFVVLVVFVFFRCKHYVHIVILFISVWRVVKEMMTTSAWKDREHPCQILKIMFCYLQVSLYHLINTEPVFLVICDLICPCIFCLCCIVYKGNDGQKRRRLESSGRENQSPKPSSSGRVTEQQTKPDTPVVPSVRSRVQLLTRKQDGNQLLLILLLFFSKGSFQNSFPHVLAAEISEKATLWITAYWNWTFKNK